MPNETLTGLPEWSALVSHKKDIEDVHMREMFAEDRSRFTTFSVELDGFLFDYSKHRINRHTIELLCNLAKIRRVEEIRTAMFGGDAINLTEGRSVLHPALRGSVNPDLHLDGERVMGFVEDTLERMEHVAEKIRREGKITDIVNIGIGGSDLGPKMVCKALTPLADGPHIHFVSNMDGRALEDTLKKLDPETTLLIIVSKTFTTLETISNARAARKWLLEGGVAKEKLPGHLLAVTNNTEEALEFGITTEHIFPMRDWIGGRFSLWGAVGLTIALGYGFRVFKELLAGAHLADDHFLKEPFERNIPVLMAMLGVWYRNFWKYPAHAVIPYAHDLTDFPRYLQQLDMESNGKSVNINSERVECETGSIIFGEAGTNAQHAFMQLFHQGTTIIPTDIIVAAKSYDRYPDHHAHLFSNALAQSKALMEGLKNKNEPHRNFSGNRPSSVFLLKELDARRLGMLIAFYEHKIFVQGVIWGINSFDQWGVELGKSIAKNLYNPVKDENDDLLKDSELDNSTSGLIEFFHQCRKDENTD